MFRQIDDDSEIKSRLKQSVNDSGILATLVKIIAFPILFALLVIAVVAIKGYGMTDAADARRVLEQSGYTHVQITGYRWFTCGKGDYYQTGFAATSPNGSQVTGTVCKGLLFKSQTIRMD